MNGCNTEDAARQRTGLIENNRLYIRQSFYVIWTLNENTRPAGTADGGKEGQRHTDNQRTGATDNKKGQGTVYPDMPITFPRRKESEQGR